MRSKIVKQIFKKEMLDILRDKKTIFMMIILPIILYPLLMVGMTQIMSMSMNNMETKDINIAFKVDKSQVDDTLLSMLEQNVSNSKTEEGKINVLEVKDYKKALEKGEISAYIDVNKEDKTTKYSIYTNFANDDSAEVLNRLEEVLKNYKLMLSEKKITESGLDINEILNPITYEKIDVAKNEEIAGYLLGQILPVILIVGVLLGAIYPAIDVMAGEKERGTLETLFTLPITNLELVMGKYMAVSFSAIVTAILNILSILLTMVFIMSSGGMASELGISTLNLSNLIFPMIITMVCICLFAMVVSAISMCVCSLAKSFKDAQNYITPVMLIVMIPSYVSMIPNMVLNQKSAVIPVVNISLLIKSVMNFNTNIDLIALVLVSNFVFVILSVLLLSKMFNSEEILFGNGRSFTFLEKRSNMKKGEMPSISDGAVLYAIGLVLLIYLGSILQVKLGRDGIALTQVMLVSLPLLLAYYIKTNFKKVFSLKLPSIRNILGSVLLWMGVYIVVILSSQILLYLFPQGIETAEALEGAMFGVDSFWINLIVIAIFPAVCEELFFRGFILSSFRSKGSVKGAIIGSAILFGFMHISFIKIIPTAILGAALAYAVYKSGSIFVAMIMHLLNNGFAVFIMHNQNSPIAQIEKFLTIDFSNLDILKLIMLLAISFILSIIGIALLKKSKR